MKPTLHGALRYCLVLFSITLSGALHSQDSSEVRLNRAIELLEAGDAAFGILSFDYSLTNARGLARSGLDFIIIDMEHSPYNEERIRSFLLGMTDKRAIQRKGNLQPDVTPVVRIPASGGQDIMTQVKQVLDLGAFGIMFPSINNAAETRLAISAMRYPQLLGVDDFEPEGLRGRNPSNAAWYWGTSDYVSKADVWPLDPDGELLAIIQIETPQGVENIDSILSVPGVSIIFIGPSDLSAAMGYASPSAPEVEAAIQAVLEACLERGVPCAITTGPGTVERRLEEGFRFVTVGIDGRLPASSQEGLRIGREAAGRQ